MKRTKARMKRWGKPCLSMGLALLVLLTAPLGALAAQTVPDRSQYSQTFLQWHDTWPSHSDEAESLKYLGLFQGTESGLELRRAPTRIEALVTVLRLIGQEKAAKEQCLETSFSDVPAWATAYAGYGEANGLVQGVGGGLLGASDPITAQQYGTMMLRVLGYDEKTGDFQYQNALAFAHEIGLVEARGWQHYQSQGQMLRDDVAYFMERTLRQEAKGQEIPFLLSLCQEGVLDPYLVYGTLLAKKESPQEIARALKNGYSEYWVSRLEETIDNNGEILALFNPVFKDCVYGLLKEPSLSGGAAQLDYTLARLKTATKNATQDTVFKNSPETAAYFLYPNYIAVRHDLNSGMILSALTHELRHAITRNIENNLVEEGLTDLWNQEVYSGRQGYPYYYVNIAKVFTFLIGPDEMNRVDFSGGIEALLYELEESTGVAMDKNEFPYALYLLSEGTPSEEKLNAVRQVQLALLEGYYAKNQEQLQAKAQSPEAYVDTLIALGQLLYYPSAMIQNVDDSVVSQAPSAFYTKEFEAFAEAQLAEYAKSGSASLSSLQAYYKSEKNQRYCMKFWGPEAGQILKKGAMAYVVTYQNEKRYYSADFGSLPEAQRFQSQVKSGEIKEKPGAAFTVKDYH